MSRTPGAPMPETLRATLTRPRHRATTVPCPACRATADARCTSPRGRIRSKPHESRITAWARTVACCPECQVAPGAPCRTVDGEPLADRGIHDRRLQEAEATT